MPRPRFHLRSLLTVAVGLLAFAGTAVADPHGSGVPVVAPDAPGGGSVGSAAPATIVVSGEPAVTRLTLGLTGIQHDKPDDIDILLVGPGGESVVLMSDAGADYSIGSLAPDFGGDAGGAGVDLVFDDAAVSGVPDEAFVGAGTYQPSNYGKSVLPACTSEPDPDLFPSAPSGPYGSTMSVFDGTDPNGAWTLFVVDDCAGASGALQNGWTVNVNPPTSAVGVARFGARAGAGRVALSWRTANEADLLGFNVFRSSPTARQSQINRTLVPARLSGRSGAASYRLVDARVRRGVSYTYRLQVVRVDGSRGWAGSSALRAR
jgi:hypothetical protein